MRKNEKIAVKGSKVTLVPYNKEHVAKYHEWMKSEELQELTASEPLSLDDEYRMQQSWREDEDTSMVGDTNLFFTDTEDDSVAEIEVMIAEMDYRGKGLGKEALLLMMAYGFSELNKRTFIAKIKVKNAISRHMFEKLEFAEIDRSDVFEEVTYRLVLNDWQELLAKHNTTFELTRTE